MRRVTIALVFGLLGFGLFVTAVAMAAPTQPAVAPLAGDGPLYDVEPITDTDTYSPTTTHPVASAIAKHFEVEYSEIAALHDEEGLGFGVISHMYFIADTWGIEIAVLKDQFLLEGMGWGEILKYHELPRGLAGFGGNLGSIMSSPNKKGDDWMPPGQLKKSLPDGEGWTPPGQLKKDESDGDGFVPPGQLKKSVEDEGGEGDRGGPPSAPPGQEKAKDKAKGKDKK
jgi:hypothetical protein